MRRLPPLGALEAFVVVAQQGGLRAAADELSLSTSALSRRVQALENHLGRRVFDRANGEFRLTEEGRDLLDEVIPALERLNRVLEQLSTGGREEVRVGVMPAFANAWLLPRLAGFKARYPKIEVVLETSQVQLARLSAGIDVAIRVADHPEAGLHSRQLCQQRVLAVCSPELLRRAPALEGPEDIAGHTLIVHRSMPELIDVWLEGAGVAAQPRAVEQYDSGPLLLEAACLGLGVAIVFDTMVPALLDSGRLVRPFREEVESPLNYWFFCKPAALAARPVQRFHDWIVQEALGAA